MVAPAVLLLLAGPALAATSVRNVYWNTTTAMLSDGGPVTVTVNQGNLPWEYDQVNIICPVYKPGSLGAEQHIIYSVEREEFEQCRVTSARPRIVAICNRPHTFMYFTITFRSFTPTPGGLEFRPGQDYYFISTSNSKDIHRRAGGWCGSHNMKMIFKVAETQKPLTSADNPTTHKSVGSPSAFWSRLRPVEPVSDNSVDGALYRQRESETYSGGYSSPARLRNREPRLEVTITSSSSGFRGVGAVVLLTATIAALL